MYNPPDRPLVVKCTFGKWHKRITFSSARNCSYDLLRRKVDQGFALSATSYAVTYKDDDGEITNITTDDDLIEAIQYFQAGDDAPLSSAASILSGRSFGPRKITLRVDITVDYDGPSLSDTSSLASLDDFKLHNESQPSVSLSAALVDIDDDSVTVSSRDIGSSSTRNGWTLVASQHHLPKQTWKTLGDGAKDPASVSTSRSMHEQELETSASDHCDEVLSASERYPSDPSLVFERLKLSDTSTDDNSIAEVDVLAASERGAAWLRDQNERAIRSKLGALPEPSDSDAFSLLPVEDALGGDLALERDPRGKYYYTYTSGSVSQGHWSIYDEGQQSYADGDIEVPNIIGPPRPTSMHLNWLASQQVQRDTFPSKADPATPEMSDHNPHIEYTPFPPCAAPPDDLLTDCSNCGVVLDAIRYVCSTCGPKSPIKASASTEGKDREDSPVTVYSYSAGGHPLFSSPNFSTSQTIVASSSLYSDNLQNKPLPSLPPSVPSPVSGGHGRHLNVPTISSSSSNSTSGYELCALCLETVGVHHAIEAGLAAPGSSPVSGTMSPTSPDDPELASQWRRAAPKKGQMRHAYRENLWTHHGWEDVVLDEYKVSKCSTCSAITERKRYKCVSCEKMFLCRACYSQVHELHPSHAFCIVPDRPIDVFDSTKYFGGDNRESNDEPSLVHPGVECAHCLQPIVGARFHCAICDAVDICSNCESAGLPGNLDSADGGHNSSHILIKIPYPLENAELQNASRHALQRWTGRDAAHVAFGIGRRRGGSDMSSYAQTLIGPGSRNGASSSDHHLFCNGCDQSIIGVRYQCAHCPSKPVAYNLCSACEMQSFLIHDPMHIFIKLPRLVHRPIQEVYPILPPLYKTPAGTPAHSSNSHDPRAYLETLVHSSALCDRCMTPIQGEWFRCCYCGQDLCDACESVDTHNDTHVFVVFKSAVDMASFRSFANLDNHGGGTPVIPYPVYR